MRRIGYVTSVLGVSIVALLMLALAAPASAESNADVVPTGMSVATVSPTNFPHAGSDGPATGSGDRAGPPHTAPA